MKLPDLTAQRRANRQAQIYRDLIHREAKIGGQLFGNVARGGRREFFCLDRHTWVWHEEWIDAITGKRHIVTTRYEVRPGGVFKAQDSQGYRKVTGAELRNFYQAIQKYHKRVKTEIYGAVV